MTAEQVWAALDEIPDPEIPVVSLVDLGVIRSVDVHGGHVRVELTFISNVPDRIVSVPADPVCWTEAPESLGVLRGQRTRWQRGLGQSLALNRALICHPRGGAPGWLSLPFMVAFELLRIEGLSHEEAAEVLGTTVSAVKLRAFRAYAALRAALGGSSAEALSQSFARAASARLRARRMFMPSAAIRCVSTSTPSPAGYRPSSRPRYGRAGSWSAPCSSRCSATRRRTRAAAGSSWGA